MTQHKLKLLSLTNKKYTDKNKVIPIRPKLSPYIQNIKKDTWLNTYIDDNYQHIDVIEHIKGMISYFMEKYNITMSKDFDEDLIDFLYKHSSNNKYLY
jgi:hypothetical protein